MLLERASDLLGWPAPAEVVPADFPVSSFDYVFGLVIPSSPPLRTKGKGQSDFSDWPLFNAGNYLLSHTLSRAVPSAQQDLTSVQERPSIECFRRAATNRTAAVLSFCRCLNDLAYGFNIA